MNNKRNRRIALVVAVLMLTMAFSSTGFAAWMGKTMEAQYRNISIFVNSEYKQATDVNSKVVEPFIVDGTTYVPLRGIAQMLGYEVSFNPATYRIDITGNVAGSTSALQYQLMIKDARIAELEAKLAEKEDSTIDMDDLEDDLYDDYDQIGKVDVKDIKLKGDEEDIRVEIYIDTTKLAQYDEWELLNEADIEDYLQDIVDDILDEFDDADITGFIQDNYNNKKVITFGITSRGKVDLDGGSYSGGLSGLESEIDDDFDKLKDLSITKIELDGDEDDIEVAIYFNTSRETQWNAWKALKDIEIEDYLQDIVDTILDEYPDASVEGSMIDQYDDYAVVEFTISSAGSVRVTIKN